MEERKLKEIEYYDRQAGEESADNKEAGSLAEFDPFLLGSYQFLRNYLKDNKDKTVLDYGCGTGCHLPWLAKSFNKVTGIDLSQNSLDKAQKLSSGAVLVLGDCEKMPFPNESFDVVFNGGTFSSLDLDVALKEIHRVLKPNGLLAGIETLGHNPLTNFKRKINKFLGKRTSWAESHIFRIEDLERVKKYFNIRELQFFHVTSWAAFPFLRSSGGKLFLKLLEKLDHFLLSTLPFLKKYSFKIVFLFQKHA